MSRPPKAKQAIARGDASTGIRILTKRAGRRPDDVASILRLGQAKERAGKACAREYESVLARDPTCRPAVLGLARTSARRGEAGEALRLLAGLRGAAATSAEALATRALVFACQGEAGREAATEAIEAARRAAALTKDKHARASVAEGSLEVNALLDPLDEVQAWWPQVRRMPGGAPLVVGTIIRRGLAERRAETVLELLGSLGTLSDDGVVLNAFTDLASWYLTAPGGSARARELVRALRSQAGDSLWTRTVKRLVSKGELEQARWLLEASPNPNSKMTAIVDRLPDASRVPATVRHRLADKRSFVVERSPGSATRTVLVFARSPLHAQVIHEQLVGRGVHVVHALVTGSRTLLAALPDADFATVIAHLRAMLDDLGAPAVTIGSCGGGLPAIRFGLELDLDAALLLGPMTTLEPSFPHGRRRLALLERVWRSDCEFADDPRPYVEARNGLRRIDIHYPAASHEDTAQAKILEGAPGVRLHPRTGDPRHNVLLAMNEDGSLRAAVDELLA